MKKINIKYEIIVINDGSEDHTKKKLLRLKSNEKFIKIINNEKNMGKSYSVIRGLRFSNYNHVILN